MKLKQKSIVLGFIMTSLLFITLPSFAQSPNPIGVIINNTPVTFTEQSGYPFADENARVQVPFRQTMVAIGCKVDWNQDTQTAIAEKDGIRVEVPIGQSFIYKNGQQVVNDTAAQIKDKKTYLPIRVVLESFGFDVEWDGIERRVVANQNAIVKTIKLMPGIKIDLAGTTTDVEYEQFKTLWDITMDERSESDIQFQSCTLTAYYNGDLGMDNAEFPKWWEADYLKYENYAIKMVQEIQVQTTEYKKIMLWFEDGEHVRFGRTWDKGKVFTSDWWGAFPRPSNAI